MTFQQPSFQRAWKKLPPAAQTTVTAAVGRLETSFGRPHLHAGIGLRPFGRYFELRASLGLRVLFLVDGGDFFLITVGPHDHVRAYLKNNG